MKTLFLILLSFMIIFFESCCHCDDIEQEFSFEEQAWIPSEVLGDSVIFINGDTLQKIFHIRAKENFIDPCKLAGPGCCCPEDDIAYYNDQITGEIIPNTQSIREGLTINLEKTNNTFTKTFSWSCIYGKFQEFDSYFDTLNINGTLYNSVFVKELSVCNIEKIFFNKNVGLLRFDLEDSIWERKN